MCVRVFAGIVFINEDVPKTHGTVQSVKVLTGRCRKNGENFQETREENNGWKEEGYETGKRKQTSEERKEGRKEQSINMKEKKRGRMKQNM